MSDMSDDKNRLKETTKISDNLFIANLIIFILFVILPFIYSNYKDYKTLGTMYNFGGFYNIVVVGCIIMFIISLILQITYKSDFTKNLDNSVFNNLSMSVNLKYGFNLFSMIYSILITIVNIIGFYQSIK